MTNFLYYKDISYIEAKRLQLRPGNRLINRLHVAKILRALIDDYYAIPAIRVNKRTGHITDGQHRWEAYKKAIDEGLIPMDTLLRCEFLDIPEEEEIKSIIESNINSKGWQLDDFIHLYATMGVTAYVELEKWCKAHALTYEKGKPKYRYGSAIIKGKHCGDDIKNGVFSITEAELKEADEAHNEMLDLIDRFNFKGKGPWMEAFAISWRNHRKMHPYKEWVKAMKRMENKISKMPKDNGGEWNTILSMVHTAIDIRSVA